jgi:pyruvate carboxylase
MYPEVFTNFNASLRTYGPVSVLPTPVYFYGMKPSDEIAVTIQSGKTMVISLQTLGATDEDGNVRAFFELNGQPRVITVPNRSVAATRPARRKADEADAKQIGAPMPGSISAILVREDQKVTQGEPLLAIEAMKMEAQLAAPRDGTVKHILVRPGEQVDAKDLLIEFV